MGFSRGYTIPCGGVKVKTIPPFIFPVKSVIVGMMKEKDPEIQRIIELFRLERLPREGGYFRRTYRSDLTLSPGVNGSDKTSGPRGGDAGSCRGVGSAIYYLITPGSFSSLHLLSADELWHFYGGDPVEQLRLFPDGTGEIIHLGPDWERGEVPQVLVPAGVWQGSRLAEGGRYALVGNTVHPEFLEQDYTHGDFEELIGRYPEWRGMIEKFISPAEAD